MIMKNYYAMYKEGERERDNLLTLSHAARTKNV
jgi:hypothetical protein